MKTIMLIIAKKPIDAAYPTLTEEIEANQKSPKPNVDDVIRIAMYQKSFRKGYSSN